MAAAGRLLEQEQREGRLGERNMEIGYDDYDDNDGDSEETDDESKVKKETDNKPKIKKEEQSEPYIEMNLGLGVLEEQQGGSLRGQKRRRRSGRGRGGGDTDGDGDGEGERQREIKEENLLPPLIPQGRKTRSTTRVKIESVD